MGAEVAALGAPSLPPSTRLAAGAGARGDRQDGVGMLRLWIEGDVALGGRWRERERGGNREGGC